MFVLLTDALCVFLCVLQVKRIREQSDLEISTLRKERMELLDRVAALSGGTAEAEAAMEAKLAQSRQERIELFMRQMGRRLMNQQLSHGWIAWVELYQATVHAKEELRLAANTMRAPQLSSAFAVWARAVLEAKSAMAMTQQEVREKELQDEIKRVKDACEM